METTLFAPKGLALRVCRLGLFLIPIAGFAQVTQDLAALVNPFVGTRTSSIHDNGYTTPGAVRPFGLLYWGPDTPDIINYHYDHPVTYGFSLTHISGPGVNAFGDVPIFPMMGAPVDASFTNSTQYQAAFSHDHEMAEPGYYQVTLESGIQVRLAAQMRAGIAEFRFPPGEAVHTLRIDTGHNMGFNVERFKTSRIRQAEISFQGRMATGSVASQGIGRSEYQVYFAIEADQTPQTYGTFDEAHITTGNRSASGPRTGGYLGFAPSARTVRLRVGISFVSVANAEENLRREIPGWDLDQVRKNARAVWNETLGRVQVKGGEEKDRKIFYTALYHALLSPSVFSDRNGEYKGFDGKVHTDGGHLQYTNFSGWDIYRSQVQLLAMLFPKEASDMAQSLVRCAEQGGGGLPQFMWANAGVQGMVGDPSALILAGLYGFGTREFDVKAALAAMLRGANDPQTRSGEGLSRPYLDEYLQHGYITGSAKPVYGAASIALEYENADFAISRLADALGDSVNARAFLVRSGQWRKLFDPETKYIRPRGPDGRFLPGFTPTDERGFVEGNSTHYTWMIPYDLPGVIAAVGGREAARARLDEYFSQYFDWQMKRGPYVFISNEECFGNPWIYNWTGHPWRTQEVIRKIVRDLFSADPGGLPGNHDLGSLSSWVVFAQLGLYPEIPGIGGLTLNSPMFPEISLRLGHRLLKITAAGAPSKLYVQSVRLDGEVVRNWWIDWVRLSKASKLEFALGTEANHDPGLQPPSFAPGDK